MSNSVIVVTGGFGVLGRALGGAARSAEWRLAAVDVGPEPVTPRGDDVLTLGAVDLTDAGAAGRAMEAVAKRFGRIDALANVAGGFVWKTVEDADPGVWERMSRLNLTTAVNASRAAMPHLIASGRGRIVNVGANGALKAGAGMGPYAASKSGVHRLTEALAEELKGRVAVNAVLPSILDTPQNRADMPDANPGTWVTPAALAKVILFLAGDDSGPVTGALLPVTGGV